MRPRLVLLPLAGFAVALAVASASASDASIAAQADLTWNPATVTIRPGEKVTWSNGNQGFHDVRIAGESQSLVAAGPSWSVSRTFDQAGTFRFYCTIHSADGSSGMTGTITVRADDTGTGTTPPPPPGAMPTETITTPTDTTPAQTDTTPAADTGAPSFAGRPKRRASRRSLVLELRSSEDATLLATVFRRPPRGRSFTRIAEASLPVSEGRNVVRLPRTAGPLRSGAYRVKLQLVDAAGNTSAATTIRFKLA